MARVSFSKTICPATQKIQCSGMVGGTRKRVEGADLKVPRSQSVGCVGKTNLIHMAPMLLTRSCGVHAISQSCFGGTKATSAILHRCFKSCGKCYVGYLQSTVIFII